MTTSTETVIRTPVESRGAWMGAELAAGDDWLVALTDAQQAELRDFAEGARARGLELADIGPDTSQFAALAPMLETIESEIENGLGLVVLRGFDLAGLSPDAAGPP